MSPPSEDSCYESWVMQGGDTGETVDRGRGDAIRGDALILTHLCLYKHIHTHTQHPNDPSPFTISHKGGGFTFSLFLTSLLSRFPFVLEIHFK